MSNVISHYKVPISTKPWKIGELIILVTPIHTNKMHTVGVVYQTIVHEGEPCVAILLETGADVGLQEMENIQTTFMPLGHSALSYEFTNPATLMADFKKGFFFPCFLQARQYAFPTT